MRGREADLRGFVPPDVEVLPAGGGGVEGGEGVAVLLGAAGEEEGLRVAGVFDVADVEGAYLCVSC